MDIRRAKDIASSSIMANVVYNGSQIYIESVIENKGTAFIHPLKNPKARQEVPLDSLREQ